MPGFCTHFRMRGKLRLTTYDLCRGVRSKCTKMEVLIAVLGGQYQKVLDYWRMCAQRNKAYFECADLLSEFQQAFAVARHTPGHL